MTNKHTLIVGAGMAGLAAAITLASHGEKVTLLEKQSYPGGKMRQQKIGGSVLDAGPTVLTMKWVFENLFASAGSSFENEISLQKAAILARHAWDGEGQFDLFADQEHSENEIARFFDSANAAGYRRFCADSKAIYETLSDTFIAAPRPSPLELGRRIGFTNFSALQRLRPFQTMWRALGDYFPDDRLRQLFGRYATYVGSSPYSAPATLMLIAHVEQEGVWFVEGGMHSLASSLASLAAQFGAEFKYDCAVQRIATSGSKATGVELATGEKIEADHVVYCGDASQLSADFLSNGKDLSLVVPASKRSLSALTWSVVAKTSGFDLHRHNVFFSGDYQKEFDELFDDRQVPSKPTVYVCAQDRETAQPLLDGSSERLLCLINAPAFGDHRTLCPEELSTCKDQTFSLLDQCGLKVELDQDLSVVTQPADFETLFPGSGGAIYGRASHGWAASFARPGTKTPIPGLYLAGGSVHPGAGVPMAALSGMLAAEQIIADRALT